MRIDIRARLISNRFPALNKAMSGAVRKAIKDTADQIATRAKLAMAEEKHGNVYLRGKNRRHVASAPGEAPAIDFGTLVNSIETGFESKFLGFVSASADYAPHLEFGTIRMAPRPYFGPAAEAERPEHTERIRKALGGVR